MHFFSLIYFNNHRPLVSNRLTIDDEQLIYLKHVEGDC